MRSLLKLLAVSTLSLLFTIALFYVTIEVPRIVHEILLETFPDWWWPPREEEERIIEFLRPIGYAAFASVLALIFVGFAVGKRYLSALGSVAFYLPIFAHFAHTMFFLAGIGVLRALWFPLTDISPSVLKLGDSVYAPYLALAYLFALFTGTSITQVRIMLWVALTGNMILVGLAIFTFGTMTWLYGKFKGLDIIDFWIYRVSRHPQYLGFLIWSYGLLLFAANFQTSRMTPAPSLPWLISALIVVGAALKEEVELSREYGEKYERYRDRTPFMLPLSRNLAALITAPIRVLRKKRRPEDRKDITFIITFYGAILILLSIPSTL